MGRHDNDTVTRRLKDVSIPKLRKAIHKVMTKHYDDKFYKKIDLIKKILRKLKVARPVSKDHTKIRNMLNRWISVNRPVQEDNVDNKKDLKIKIPKILNCYSIAENNADPNLQITIVSTPEIDEQNSRTVQTSEKEPALSSGINASETVSQKEIPDVANTSKNVTLNSSVATNTLESISDTAKINTSQSVTLNSGVTSISSVAVSKNVDNTSVSEKIPQNPSIFNAPVSVVNSGVTSVSSEAVSQNFGNTTLNSGVTSVSSEAVSQNFDNTTALDKNPQNPSILNAPENKEQNSDVTNASKNVPQNVPIKIEVIDLTLDIEIKKEPIDIEENTIAKTQDCVTPSEYQYNYDYYGYNYNYYNYQYYNWYHYNYGYNQANQADQTYYDAYNYHQTYNNNFWNNYQTNNYSTRPENSLNNHTN